MELWCTLSWNAHIDKANAFKSIINTPDVECKVIFDLLGKANTLSNYFNSVFTPPGVVPTLSCAQLSRIIPLPFDLNNIVKLLKELNTSKAAGSDSIHIRMLINAANEIPLY